MIIEPVKKSKEFVTICKDDYDYLIKCQNRAETIRKNQNKYRRKNLENKNV